jgi:hypothetical protein
MSLYVLKSRKWCAVVPIGSASPFMSAIACDRPIASKRDMRGVMARAR